ncbi:MAG TPA: aminotransferase class I/II-fold pyridoxal phosphate-dependent enzyme [Gemmatimonadaceae bacterium]|jgi:aspartate aminotransferase|nr:aminotransferase class I/II-fold pyridoxal phosphate-dependent enzyme [Gemmatimonadaceae bacterium]
MTNRLSALSRTLRGSAILDIAGEVRALIAQGHEILNLTVGDFSAAQFPIPRELEDAIIGAVRAGETTYPPPAGMDALRAAIREFYHRRLGIDVPTASVLVAGGARPVIYSAYRALIDPGDRVVFGVPCWNNDYYCQLTGADAVTIDCSPDTGFLPTADAIRPHLRGARLLALGSPLNPTGTAMDRDQLGAICDLVLAENARRGPNERPLFVLYDQVYWMLTVGGTEHVHPIGVRPAMAPYTVYVDAISKSFASTGLRVGWAVGPADVISAMNNVCVHMGSWAPRPEQVATAKLLMNDAAVDTYIAHVQHELDARLTAVHEGLGAMARDGLPVDSVRPQGGIYVSAQFALHGLQRSSGDVLRTDDDVRRYLLREAGFAIVPFKAFGSEGDRGWFRISIGIVTVPMIESLLPRLRAAVAALAPAEIAAD